MLTDRVCWSMVVALLTVIPLSGLAAQGATGRIEGVVRASSGAPMPRARVMIVGSSFTTLTDSVGAYRFPEVPAGALTIRAVQIGYKTSVVEGIRLAAGQTIRQDFALDQSAVAISDGRAMPEGATIRVASVTHVGNVNIWTRVRVEGCVRTATGAPVRAAHVEFIGLNRSAATDTTGFYAMDSVPGGLLAIRVRADGYRASLVEGLRLGAAAMIRQDFILEAVRGNEGGAEPSISPTPRPETDRPVAQPLVTLNPGPDRLGPVREPSTYVDGVPTQLARRSCGR